MYYERKTADSFCTNKEKKWFLYQILKLNEAILNELSSKKHKDKRKINWSTLDKSRDYFLLLSELKQKQVYSFTEKRMSSLVRINEENFIRKIVNHNIQYFTNELKKVEALISNEKECERNRSSVSSEVSDDSESDASSSLNLENDKQSGRKSKSSSSKS